MNIKPSLLAIISAISCVSLYQNDAVADACQAKGWYRWASSKTSTDWCMPCPAGCYCDEKADDKKAVIGGDKWLKCSSNLEQYGIYRCGDGWTSDSTSSKDCSSKSQTYCQGPMDRYDCYFTAKDTKNKVRKTQTTIKCNAGTYVKAGYEKCQPCPSGKICPGTKLGHYSGINNDRFQEALTYSTWKSDLKKDKTHSTLYLSPNSDSGIYNCPSGKSANSNHTECVDAAVAAAAAEPKQVRCDSGKYLPANATSCSSCQSGRYYCPGGTFTVASFTQGLKECAYGETQNSTKSACQRNKIHCDAGQYLPASTNYCTACENDRYYCPGGDFDSAGFNQGLFKCPDYAVSNSSKTACVDATNAEIYCDTGYYLPASSMKCERCSSSQSFCNGGTFRYALYDQGFSYCLPPSMPNIDNTSCITVLSKDYLKYGPAGERASIDLQCWTKKRPEDYIRCMSDTDVVEYNAYSTTSNRINSVSTPMIQHIKNIRTLPSNMTQGIPASKRKEVMIINKNTVDNFTLTSSN